MVKERPTPIHARNHFMARVTTPPFLSILYIYILDKNKNKNKRLSHQAFTSLIARLNYLKIIIEIVMISDVCGF